MRSKKVDMKQLKHTTWKILTGNTDTEKPEVADTTFQTVYSQLPNRLSSTSRESLSLPLALLSILHLANEKGLRLKSQKDLKDFTISGLCEE